MLVCDAQSIENYRDMGQGMGQRMGQSFVSRFWGVNLLTAAIHQGILQVDGIQQNEICKNLPGMIEPMY